MHKRHIVHIDLSIGRHSVYEPYHHSLNKATLSNQTIPAKDCSLVHGYRDPNFPRPENSGCVAGWRHSEDVCFVAQSFCMEAAPVFYSTAIYTLISVMIRCAGNECASFPPTAIFWSSITYDIVTTIIQITGAALVDGVYLAAKEPHTPDHILLAGLAF